MNSFFGTNLGFIINLPKFFFFNFLIINLFIRLHSKNHTVECINSVQTSQFLFSCSNFIIIIFSIICILFIVSYSKF